MTIDPQKGCGNMLQLVADARAAVTVLNLKTDARTRDLSGFAASRHGPGQTQTCSAKRRR